tara:strand:- start:1269 stop:1697 length:429 start_codon:yes stop_codon:yes gene_type:complete
MEINLKENMDLLKLKTLNVGDLVVYEFGKLKYMAYCYKVEGDYGFVHNIAVMEKNGDQMWEMIPQENMDEFTKELCEKRNKIMSYATGFEIHIPALDDDKELNFVNLSAIYNFDERVLNRIKSYDWSMDSWNDVLPSNKEIH